MSFTRRQFFVASLLLGLAAPLLGAEKWALLIGVNDYVKGPESWDLRGCVNDVHMTRELLTTKFGFPEDNIKILLDGQATAGNIVRAIQEWLVERTRPEDIVYFHFSGHGSQMKDLDSDEADGRDELICPADMERGNLRSVITDDQLRTLFARIPSRNVTIVIDACHAGTGTRDLALSRARFVEFEEEGETRAVVVTPVAQPPATVPAPPQAELPKNKLEGSGGMEGNGKLQVSIAGCRPDQTSADAHIGDGFFAGALTYNLVQNMKKAPTDITYRQLMERVVRGLKVQKFTQVPQIEGDMDRPLFGTKIDDAVEVPFLVVQSAREKGLVLNGGRAQKVTHGSIYALFGPHETTFAGAGLGRIKITQVAETTSKAMLLDDVAVSAGYRAHEILHNPAPDKLKLYLEASDSRIQEEVENGLAGIDFVQIVASSENHFDHRLKVSGGADEMQAALTIDGVAGTPVKAEDVASLVEALRPLLENAYAIKYLANLDNPGAPFKVEVWANRSTPGARDLIVEALDEAPNEKMVQARIGDIIRFNFRVERDCYLTLINVGTSGKITVLFPNQYHPASFVQGGRLYQTETRGEMPFKIRARGPAGRELVKAVATLEPLDLGNLLKVEEADLHTFASGSRFARQLTRSLAVRRTDARAPLLLPTDEWATDYMIIETTP